MTRHCVTELATQLSMSRYNRLNATADGHATAPITRGTQSNLPHETMTRKAVIVNKILASLGRTKAISLLPTCFRGGCNTGGPIL